MFFFLQIGCKGAMDVVLHTFILARPWALGSRSSIPLLRRRSKLCSAPLLEARRD